MGFKVVVSSAVKQEMTQAYDWYRRRSPSAAIAFRQEVLSAIELVSLDPERWTQWEGPIRRYVLKQYPYTIYFSLVGEEVRILAIGHHRRRPGYWRAM